MQTQIRWQRLKNNKCPKCNGLLQLSPLSDKYICTADCDFIITGEKFKEIIDDLYRPKKYRTFEENLGELNNLGVKELTEDFSDSRHLDY